MKTKATDFCLELLNKSFDEYDELKEELKMAKDSANDLLFFEMPKLAEARRELILELEEKVRAKEIFYTEFLKQIIGRK